MCLRKQKVGGLLVNHHQFYIEVVVRTADQESQRDSGETQSPGPTGLKASSAEGSTERNSAFQ